MSTNRLPSIGAERKLRDLEASVVVAYANFVVSRYRNEVPAGTRATYEYVVPEGLAFDVVRDRIANLVGWLHRPGGGFTRTMRLLEARQKRLIRIQADEKEPVRDEIEAAIFNAELTDAEIDAASDHSAQEREMDKDDPGANDLRKLRGGK